MTNKIRAIILAAGDGKRWGNYLGVNKCMIEINGEPLLHRTIRLLRENGIDDIVVTGDWKEMPAKTERQKEKECEIDRFYGIRHLFKENNIVLYGDAYYTEKAIKTIVLSPSLSFCGRFDRNEVKNYGELFAIKFRGDEIVSYCKKLRDDFLAGKIRRCIGWELYRSMSLLPLNEHKIKSHLFVELPADETEDFDKPEDYDKWIKKYGYKTSSNK